MIPAGYFYDTGALHDRLVKALPPRLAKWRGKGHKRALLAAIEAALTPPPEAPPKHHWISHYDGGQLVATMARDGVFAIHTRGEGTGKNYVVDHVPSGLEVQTRKQLGQAKEVMRVLAREFPTFGGTWRKAEQPSQELTRRIAALRAQHGLSY